MHSACTTINQRARDPGEQWERLALQRAVRNAGAKASKPDGSIRKIDDGRFEVPVNCGNVTCRHPRDHRQQIEGQVSLINDRPFTKTLAATIALLRRSLRMLTILFTRSRVAATRTAVNCVHLIADLVISRRWCRADTTTQAE